MDFDLARSSSKLQKEQEKRRLEAQRKHERERKAQQEAKRHRQLFEEAAEQRRLDKLRQEEEEAARQAEERRITAGITFTKQLLAVDVDGEGDKVTLPPSALEELTKQDALTQGPMLFQLTLPDGRKTHCGVLEFVADEGTVGLPPKVQKSLGKMDDTPLGHVTIKYVRLEKGNYAKLRPRTGGLSFISEIRAMLERNLVQHATLTVGDVLTVWHRGKPFDIKVVELRPEDRVTIIDSDVEVDLDVPEDQAQPSGSPARPQSFSSSSAAQQTPPRVQQHANGRVSDSPTAMEGVTVGGGEGVALGGGGGVRLGGGNSSGVASQPQSLDSHQQAALLGQLPPEPEPSEVDAISCMIRRPDGGVMSRRFLKSNSFRSLFDFVSAGAAAGPGAYRLVTRFPRRVFTLEECNSKTFVDAGITANKEMFLMEVC